MINSISFNSCRKIQGSIKNKLIFHDMRITCLGGGPAGLYFSILLRKTQPHWPVRVIERNRPEDTYGWGIVFSDQTMDSFRAADEPSFHAIDAALHHWDHIDVNFKGKTMRSGGHGFAGISRAKLLNILQQRASELGVEQVFGCAAATLDTYLDTDLIVGADGINSQTRQFYRDAFHPTIQPGQCRYIWLSAKVPLDAFIFAFAQTEWGWFSLHAYRYDAEESTFIVETPESVWLAAGLDKMPHEASITFCAQLFATQLQGQKLRAIGGHPRGRDWLVFQRLMTKNWHHNNTVLIGDAAHTAHFSIGAGTKLAMEDAISLAKHVASVQNPDQLPQALTAYQTEREPEVMRLQSASRNRQEWFENVARYTNFSPEQFSYSLLTGSQRLGHNSLKLRDAAYAREQEVTFARQSTASNDTPPMFTPFQLRQLTLRNRVVVSPMATYSATDGVPDDQHLTHLGARAQGGAGLVMTEMTSPCPQGRITPACTGLWNAAQEAGWQRIVNFTHHHTVAKIGLQLGHAGPKGATQVPWLGMDEPLQQGAWPLIAASALPYGKQNALPAELSEAQMAQITTDFVAATERATRIGFDLIELHCAHGYLLSSFLSPLTNRRTDNYGDSLENRLRFPLTVFTAMRAVWPQDKPMTVRISAHDWADGGNTGNDAVAIAQAFKAAGADLIDVSSGQTTRAAQPIYGRMYQTPFADRIRQEAGIATMAVGNITQPDQINTILLAGRADLCALGRPHLSDPYWTLHAAAEQGWQDPAWPRNYQPGRDQYMRLTAQQHNPLGMTQ